MAPLVLPLLALMAGILASPYLDPHPVWLCLPLAVLLSFARRQYAVIGLFLLGAGLRSLPAAPPDLAPDTVRLTGILSKAPEWRGLGVYLDLRLLTIDAQPARGRARLTEFLNDPELMRIFNDLDLGSGDRLEIIVKLHRPPVYRNPGAFDYSRYLEREGIYWTGTIRNPRLITVSAQGWHGWDNVLAWIRNRLGRHFESDHAVAGLVKGMVLGQKYELTADIERQFQAGGLYHLVVVSGFDLAVVAAAAGWASRYLAGKRGTRLLLVIVCTLAYAAIAEGGAPVIRATIMAAFLIAGKALDRGYTPLNAAAGSAFFILLWKPMSLEDPSFLMTFAALLAVVVIGAPAARWAFNFLNTALRDFDNSALDGHLGPEVGDWRVSRRLWCELYGLPQWCITIPWRIIQVSGEALIVAASVEMVMAYFMIESFHRISPLSPLMNVPAGLIAATVTPAGLLMILLPDVVAEPLAWAMSKLLRLLIWLPYASFRVPSAPVWLWFGYAAVVSFLIRAIHKRRVLPCLGGVTVALIVQGALAFGDFAPTAPPSVVLTFLDVGQGDSALVEFPDGRRMLIDGGGIAAGRFLSLRDESTFSIGEDVVSQYLFSRRIRRLDALVLTHAHHDHLDGLFDVVKNFQIGEVWLGRNPMIPRYRDFLELLSHRAIPVRWVSAGQTFGDIEVLHPPADWKVKKTAQNNDSVVLLLRSDASAALLTGDLEMGLKLPLERVDVLKVPHHGSRNTRLNVRSPVRVISVGANNPFGHPDAAKLPALRTDELGAIRVTMGRAGVRVDWGSSMNN